MSDMRTFWQNQKMGEHTLSLYELRRRANEFQQAMRRKRLWVSSGATIAGASVVGLWRSNIPLHKLGALLLVPPLAYSLYRSYRNRRSRNVPATSFITCLEFHRMELQREISYIRNAWRELLLYVPALVAIVFGYAAAANAGQIPTWAIFIVAIFCLILWSVHKSALAEAEDLLRQQLDSLAKEKKGE